MLLLFYFSRLKILYQRQKLINCSSELDFILSNLNKKRKKYRILELGWGIPTCQASFHLSITTTYWYIVILYLKFIVKPVTYLKIDSKKTQ